MADVTGVQFLVVEGGFSPSFAAGLAPAPHSVGVALLAVTCLPCRRWARFLKGRF